MDNNTGNSPENRLPDICEHETPTKMKSSVISQTTSIKTIASSKNMPLGGIAGSSGSGSGVAAACSLAVHAPSSTPRIDISRASSSSHHEDSRDSSPENVFEQVSVYLNYSTILLNKKKIFFNSLCHIIQSMLYKYI